MMSAAAAPIHRGLLPGTVRHCWITASSSTTPVDPARAASKERSG